MTTVYAPHRSRSSTPQTPSSASPSHSDHSSPSSSDFLPSEPPKSPLFSITDTSHSNSSQPQQWSNHHQNIKQEFSPSQTNGGQWGGLPFPLGMGQMDMDFDGQRGFSSGAHEYNQSMSMMLMNSSPNGMEDAERQTFMNIEELMQPDAFAPTLPPLSPHLDQRVDRFQFDHQSDYHLQSTSLHPAQSFSPALPSLPSYPSPAPSDQILNIAPSASFKSAPPSPSNYQSTVTRLDQMNVLGSSSSSNGHAVCPPAPHTSTAAPPPSSISNLPILVHNVPLSGAKSRVETQIKMTLDLAMPSTSGRIEYERVASWKWLRLPKGCATRKRTKKEAKSDESSDDTLALSLSVHNASTFPSLTFQGLLPPVPLPSALKACSNCLAREAKRTERKRAARVRPRPQHEESDDDDEPEGGGMVVFNCTELVDFSEGRIQLPVRITCYCRHHREKVGFRVVFIMSDSQGRVIGRGVTPPIMITDDHKSVGKALTSNLSYDPAPQQDEAEVEEQPKRKRKMETYDGGESVGTIKVKKRATRANIATGMRTPDGTNDGSAPETTAMQLLASLELQTQQLAYNGQSQQSSLLTDGNPFGGLSAASSAPPSNFNTAPSSPLPPIQRGLAPSSFNSMPSHVNPSVLSATSPVLASPTSLRLPQVHRLIPSQGPTYGGIEVTVLGANFLSTHQCVFGDAVASTQMWSDNTLVCVLPASATPGPVVVRIDGVKTNANVNGSGVGMGLPLFTYIDQSDRAIMELALQTVGFNMTGRVEEAKNIAMRIVGKTRPGLSNGNSSGSYSSGSSLGLSHVDEDAVVRSVHQTGDEATLLGGSSRSKRVAGDFQSVIIDFLSVLDTPAPVPTSTISRGKALSLQNATGQTLLHLSALLGFHRLLARILSMSTEIDLDARDANGFTALHFAALSGRLACARLLLEAGADVEVVECGGRTARELAKERDQIDVEVLLDDWEARLADMDAADADVSVIGDGSEVGSLGAGEDDTKWMETEEAEDDAGNEADDEGNVFHLNVTDTSGLPHNDSGLFSSPTSDPSTLTPSRDEQDLPDFSSPNLPVLPLPSPHDDLPREDEKRRPRTSLLHRTLSHLHPPQKMITAIPRPALPPWQFPQLALHFPEFAQVFPVQMPLRAWPPWQGNANGAEKQPGYVHWSRLYGANGWWPGAGSPASPEKPDSPPPQYESTVESMEVPIASSSKVHIQPVIARRLEYDSVDAADTEREEDVYQPKAPRKLKKDRMLMLFWLPILIFVLAWGCYEFVPVILSTAREAIREYLPLLDNLRAQ